MSKHYDVGTRVKVIDDHPDFGGIVGTIDSRDDEGWYHLILDGGHRLYGFYEDELEEV